MNTTDLTKSPEEQRTIQLEDVFIIGIGVVAALAIAYFLKKIKAIPRDPPPVIIKSGSFNIEADELLINPTDSNFYKRMGFGEIRGVRVFKISEVAEPEKPDDFEDVNGLAVDIRLQRHIPGSGWQNLEPLATVRIEGDTKDFVLTIGKILTRKGRPKPPRRIDRWEDDDTENIRFGQIVVRKKDGSMLQTFDNTHGDDYMIAFYNYLVEG